MKLEIGKTYFYDGGDATSMMKAQEVELLDVDAFGFEGEVLIRSVDGSAPHNQMVSAHHLSEV